MANVISEPQNNKTVASVILAEVGLNTEKQIVQVKPVGTIIEPIFDEPEAPILKNGLYPIDVDLPVDICEKIQHMADQRKISFEACLIEIVNNCCQKTAEF